jgi:hypothetical protein
MNSVDFKYSLNTAYEVIGPRVRTTTVPAVIIALLILMSSASGLDFVYSTTTLEDEVGREIDATTSCLGAGPMSESEAETRLLSDGNNITQQCEQIISSEDGNDSTSKNYATNEVIVDDNKMTEDGGNQLSQQSKQKIDN